MLRFATLKPKRWWNPLAWIRAKRFQWYLNWVYESNQDEINKVINEIVIEGLGLDVDTWKPKKEVDNGEKQDM